ncbi:hypothetical protein L211DRAFT_895992 [Terfezia boudieri ATCC MYA-4762]|uniref:Uncharacterized protein n=1 Tax=Terfezia boudieri ATCC MYA-4762 TaxID=1051890 RepID=A0A3N4LDG3_9PEZI|nr:hypothetical protein L211DRAFT_895992 [Terfezia boudieri ATCC MYA-4762]
MCKRSFQKFFWTIATLLSLCGIVSSAFTIATQVATANLNGFIVIFVLVPDYVLVVIMFGALSSFDLFFRLHPLQGCRARSITVDVEPVGFVQGNQAGTSSVLGAKYFSRAPHHSRSSCGLTIKPV